MDEKDRISEIFRDSTVFITGGTGFLGKVLIEKLLRCTELKRIYLLVRSKKGKTPQERLHDIFNNMLFDKLKAENPKSMRKCRIISGDVSQDDLGLSPEDRLLLQDEVNFIYHSAASTRFDDSVKTAVCFNTRSTKLLLDLAHQCKNLKVFVHLSTAYAFPKEKVLYEKAYKPSVDVHHVLAVVNRGREEECEALLGDSPNTYTFSKALAEQLVVEQMDTLPVIITRPSVVCPTFKEPLPGWVNNLQGPMGLLVGAGKGIIRSMYMKSDCHADFVPADGVINGNLVATWNYLTMSKNWEEIIEMGKDIIYNDVPFNGVVWYPGGSIKKSRFVHNVCFFLFQVLPAIFIDALLIVLGYKPILCQIQKRIYKSSEVFEYYTTKAWNFSNLKVDELRTRQNKIEREKYQIDGEGVDVREYFKNGVLCVRRNNLKETDDTLSAARRHMRVMYIVDIVCKSLFVLGVLFYIYKGYKWTQRFAS